LLRGVTFSLAPGAVALVAGSSGQGKSTLLEVVAGVRAAACGDVYTDGRAVVFCEQAWRGVDGEVEHARAEWSIGQYRNALLAERVARYEPGLVVLDEPTRMLDPVGASLLAAHVEGLARSGVAVLFASHDAAWSRALATHALVLDDGRATSTTPDRVDFLAIQERTLARLRASAG
jgi:ABC-type sugar transport system ATPase subunit